MKSLLIVASLMLSMATAIDLSAQLPAQAEDISPLLIGETFPDVALTDMGGNDISILDLAKTKPAVVIFYRGGWCPYCNQHLAEIGGIESDVLELGYQVIAVSPDAAEELRETADKDEINYRLLSDASGALAKAAGIAFKAPDRYDQRLLSRSDGQNTEGYLPVPSVFLLDTDGKIEFEYINPDYKERLSGDLLMAVLRTLSERKR